jgi:hypothetical protein
MLTLQNLGTHTLTSHFCQLVLMLYLASHLHHLYISICLLSQNFHRHFHIQIPPIQKLRVQVPPVWLPTSMSLAAKLSIITRLLHHRAPSLVLHVGLINHELDLNLRIKQS